MSNTLYRFKNQDMIQDLFKTVQSLYCTCVCACVRKAVSQGIVLTSIFSKEMTRKYAYLFHKYLFYMKVTIEMSNIYNVFVDTGQTAVSTS